ncbi:MAG: SDR family oxidoreductase [Anaerolineae bacterium]|nr:SDR family oxidoreductase [Anaerolineae bacterium]
MHALQDRVTLVTGASRGIGRATALALARAGADVIAAARSRSQLETLADEIEAQTGRLALVCVADVSQEDDVNQMVRVGLERFGKIDILVNNAGVRTSRVVLWETTLEEWDAMMAVNLRSAFLCCRAVLPGMIARQEGTIINVVSTVSQIGLENMSGYGASKWGLLGMTKSLVKEARPHGIRVTALSPGGTDTTFRAGARPDYLAPETIAETIVFIASLPPQAVVHDLVIRPMVETSF